MQAAQARSNRVWPLQLRAVPVIPPAPAPAISPSLAWLDTLAGGR